MPRCIGTSFEGLRAPSQCPSLTRTATKSPGCIAPSAVPEAETSIASASTRALRLPDVPHASPPATMLRPASINRDSTFTASPTRRVQRTQWT